MSQATFAADIGKGVALGLKALGAPMATGHLQNPTKDGDEKTRYTDDDIAAIMGFSHVHRGDQVQPIWITMNNAKQKNHDVFRRQLLARMTDWAYDCRITIDTGVFLDVETVKAIVDLKFNPGEGVAHLNSAAKGLSILACRARTTGEIERSGTNDRGDRTPQGTGGSADGYGKNTTARRVPTPTEGSAARAS